MSGSLLRVILPQGDIGQCLGTFLDVTTGEGMLWACSGTRDAAKHRTMHRAALHTKNDLVQDVTHAGVEKNLL